jgi:hypothetical protein
MTLLRAQSHGHYRPSFRRCRTSATSVCFPRLDRPRPRLLSLVHPHHNRQSARSAVAPGRPFRRRSRCPMTRRSCISRCGAPRPHTRPLPRPCKRPFSHVVRHSQGEAPLTLTALLCLRPGPPPQSRSTPLATGVSRRHLPPSRLLRTNIGRRRIVIIVYLPPHSGHCCLRAMTTRESARSASARRNLPSTNWLSKNCARPTVGARIFATPHIDKSSFSDRRYLSSLQPPKFRLLTVCFPLGRIYGRLLLRLSSVQPNTGAESAWGHFIRPHELLGRSACPLHVLRA